MSSDPVTERIQAAVARIEAVRPAIEAGAPWPLAERFDDAPEAEWGPLEVLAHTAEMFDFWRTELERVADGQDAPVPFGRTAADAGRMSAIEFDRTRPPGDLIEGIAAGADRFLASWRSWTPDQRQRIGVHPRLGEITVEASAERFLASHALGHAEQLEATLGVASPGD